MITNKNIQVTGPDGRIVYVHPSRPLKAGWHVSTKEEIAAAEAKAAAAAARDAKPAAK